MGTCTIGDASLAVQNAQLGTGHKLDKLDTFGDGLVLCQKWHIQGQT